MTNDYRLLDLCYASWTGWTLRIVGIPNAESDAVLALLYDHIAESYDLQLRYKWKPNDVAIWDKRVSLPFFPLLFIW